MEWLMCLRPDLNPSTFLDELKKSHWILDPYVLQVTDPTVFSFLEDYIDQGSNFVWVIIFNMMYCPISASRFLNKLVKKYEEQFQILKKAYEEQYQILKKANVRQNQSKKGKIFHYNLQFLDSTDHWEPDVTDNNILNPMNMKKYINTSKRNEREHEHIIKLVQKSKYVPYLEEYLFKISNSDVCKILKLPISMTNLYSVIKFVYQWQPQSSNALKCKLDFIRSLSPLTAQIIFAPKQCWYDSVEDACDQCSILNWSDFLPQWRCVALCGKNQKLCSRFAKIDENFCLFHQIQKPSKQLKKQFNKIKREQDATKREYNTNPFDKSEENQPIRFHLTNRPVNPMVSLLPPYKRVKKLQEGYYLPVIRYEGVYYSQGDGDYHEKKQDQYCGKFFYFEPESNIYLHLKNSCFFATKIDAFLTLSLLTEGHRIPTEYEYVYALGGESLKLRDFVFFNSNGKEPKKQIYASQSMLQNILNEDKSFIMKHFDQCDSSYATIIFWDLFLTYRFRTLFVSLNDFNQEWHMQCIPVFLPTDQIDFENPIKPVIGEFDFLDQPICEMAKMLGFDTIVLQHEIGNHDSVSEIIHTNKDFKTHLYQFDNIETSFNQQDIYPKIWFPNENGVLHISEENNKKQISLKSRKDLKKVFSHFGRNYFAKTGLPNKVERPENLKKSHKIRQIQEQKNTNSDYESDSEPDNFG